MDYFDDKIDIPDVCQFVYLSRVFTQLCRASMAQQIEVLLGVATLGDLRNIALDGSSRFFIHNAAFEYFLFIIVVKDYLQVVPWTSRR